MDLEAKMMANCNRRMQGREVDSEELVQSRYFVELIKAAKYEKYQHS